MDFQVTSIRFDEKKLESLLTSLEDAIKRNRRMREICLEILRLQRSRGRSPPERKKRNEKPLLEVLLGVLRAADAPVSPNALREAALKAGYKTKSGARNFAITIYNAARASAEIIKTKEGYSLAPEPTRTRNKKRRKS